MKKMFVLLIAMGAFTAGSAQTNNKKREVHKEIDGSRTAVLDKDWEQNKASQNTRYDYASKEREVQQINRYYYNRIAAVRANRHLSSTQKTKQAKQLEGERAQKIREVERRYDSRYTEAGRSKRG